MKLFNPDFWNVIISERPKRPGKGQQNVNPCVNAIPRHMNPPNTGQQQLNGQGHGRAVTRATGGLQGIHEERERKRLEKQVLERFRNRDLSELDEEQKEIVKDIRRRYGEE